MFVPTKNFCKKSYTILEKYFVPIITTLIGWLKVLQQAKQQQQQQQITVDAAGKNHFLLLPYKGEKRGHLSNLWKEEYQSYYSQKSKCKWPILVKN